ncbi:MULTISPECIES: peptidoglycan-binding domain-containing protein [unclassified Spirosoma]|uniref:peptidoglycan-binding domain-containing protein n=1 Tax=unclassified Spirosoma TaxID=2621999 RepID=UPI000959ABB6|nr:MULTISPECIES: peptidoglycan-binding domain-containing protein [unclassified Spirosoma]MBN8826494.1 peptidoglycan-binding protein [Spirosoma sp.]OJW76415.1 MAG: peptidoglycan-binding protein [Spirosoma sp. 48-14]
MQKTAFQNELTISAVQQRNGSNNTKKDVRKIQAWLTLFAMTNAGAATATGIDGDFGKATEQAVKNFQKTKGVSQNGVVDQATFDLLTAPMRAAFLGPIAGTQLRGLVIEAARNQLQNRPFELVINQQPNSGPWVRAYMDGNEGSEWLWCMGFVQTILDQAASIVGKDFKQIMPLTYSCDVVGTTGLQTGALFRYSQIRANPALMKPGDIFLLQKTPNDWVHAGLITHIGDDFIETIEGNTNEGGSNNGNAVLSRVRNFRKSKLDVFSIEGLV